MSYYDAIFKDLLTNPNSSLVESLTAKSRGTPLPTDAGWYTGRSVDYISRLSDEEFVHIEVQSSQNRTMHWRMLNYYTLLQHKLYKWKRDDVTIHQYVIYLGAGRFGAKRHHPIVREKYAYTVVDISTFSTPTELTTSRFYGDHIALLLMQGSTKDNWLNLFHRICRMRDPSTKLDALFILHSLAGLRDMRNVIEDEIRRASLYEALTNSPLTHRASATVAKGEVIQTLNRLLVKRGRDVLDADQVERLEDDDFSLDEIRELLDEVIDGADLDNAIQNRGPGRTW
jgi:hypothetical protein